MEFGVLSASDPADRSQWLALLDEWQEKEPWAHPVLVDLLKDEGETALAVYLRGDAGAVLFPLVLRPFRKERWISRDSVWADQSDLSSPYGYGGPFRWGAVSSEAFWDHFDSWANEQKAVTLVSRLSLFADQLAPFRGETLDVRPNVIRSLDLSPDELWMDYRHKVRKNVKKARRSDVNIRIETQAADIESFFRIYQATMQRRDADDQYRFPKPFFEAIAADMPGQHAFIHAELEGEVVSSELVLLSRTHAYSFLGGTLPQHFDIRPNDLLKHELALWARQEKRSSYVLGGGYQGRDGIYRYKASFAPHGDVMFRIGTRVFDQEAYDGLVRTRAAYEASERGRPWQAADGYFPAYRSP